MDARKPLSFFNFKDWFNRLASAAGYCLPAKHYFIAIHPATPDNLSLETLTAKFNELSQTIKNLAYRMRWEMAKMEDPRITGDTWGEDHFWDDQQKAARAMHRSGALGDEGLCKISYNARILGGQDAGISIYYSLGEKLGRDPAVGYIGYINGMRTSLAQAGTDAAKLSDQLFAGYNIHCVYLPTRQSTLLDGARHLAVEGGGYTRSACLLAQQWIDLLDRTNKYFLQTCHSEGASHVYAALRILRKERPDLLARLRILSFAPAHFIGVQKDESLQAVNLLKKEDGVTTYLTTSMAANEDGIVQAVTHTQDHPHDQTSADYIDAARPYIDAFLNTGSILAVQPEQVNSFGVTANLT